MDNDRRKIELMTSLLLSLPGTPILYYGDELGMGDNIYLGDRNGVRTPMQWTPDRNGGFSRCDPARLYLPPIMDPVYGYQAVNVEAQSRSIASLLSWTKRMIAVRKTSQVFGRGTLSFIRPANRAVLAYLREYNGEQILCVANLSRSAQSAELDLSAWKGRIPEEMLGRARFRQISDQPFAVTLAPYGFFWFRLYEPSERAADKVSHVPEWVTLVFSDGWKSILHGRTRQVFERDVLPPFLASRRWFAHKDSNLVNARLHAAVPLGGDEGSVIAFIDVTAGDEIARYSLPLSVHWARFDRSPEQAKAATVAPVRRANREGVLVEAIAERELIATITRHIHENDSVRADGLEIAFRASRHYSDAPLKPIEELQVASGEQSNSTVLIDGDYVLKFYRRLPSGPNPEAEIGMFLTDVAKFANSPALLGTVELIENEVHYPLAVMHEYIANQGDAWAFTGAYLDRALDEQRVVTVEPEPGADEHMAFLNRMNLVGRRVGELHKALASRPDMAEFEPEPISAADLRAWTEALAAKASQVFDKLAQMQQRLDDKGVRRGRRAVDQARLGARAHSLSAADGDRRDQYPPPRRFASRPSADRQGRCLHHRLRRRAASQWKRAAAQGAVGPGRGRDYPLARLRGNGGAASHRQAGTRRIGEARRISRPVANQSGRRILCRRARNHRARRPMAAGRRSSAPAFAILRG